jgi:hypothetical protein
VLIACEGIPVLFYFDILSLIDEEPIQWGVQRLPGNVLDVAIFEGHIILSIDNIHRPGSTTVIDESTV